jgi:hypothetical protein
MSTRTIPIAAHGSGSRSDYRCGTSSDLDELVRATALVGLKFGRPGGLATAHNLTDFAQTYTTNDLLEGLSRTASRAYDV